MDLITDTENTDTIYILCVDVGEQPEYKIFQSQIDYSNYRFYQTLEVITIHSNRMGESYNLFERKFSFLLQFLAHKYSELTNENRTRVNGVENWQGNWIVASNQTVTIINQQENTAWAANFFSLFNLEPLRMNHDDEILYFPSSNTTIGMFCFQIFQIDWDSCL